MTSIFQNYWTWQFFDIELHFLSASVGYWIILNLYKRIHTHSPKYKPQPFSHGCNIQLTHRSIIDLLFMFHCFYVCQKIEIFTLQQYHKLASVQTCLLFLFVRYYHHVFRTRQCVKEWFRLKLRCVRYSYRKGIESNWIESNRCIFMFYIHIYTFHLIDLVQVLLRLSFLSYYRLPLRHNRWTKNRKEKKNADEDQCTVHTYT